MNLNLRKALDAPKQLVTATQNATVISIIALIVAAVAILMSAHHGKA